MTLREGGPGMHSHRTNMTKTGETSKLNKEKGHIKKQTVLSGTESETFVSQNNA